MNILIIEDEKLGAERLVNLIRETEPTAAIAGICASIESSVNWLHTHPSPDLIMMDIELADGQCFEIFSQVKVEAPVIFTTSYDEYALQAFRVNSIDYLLKPVDAAELSRAFEKLKTLKKTYSGSGFNVDKLIEQLRPATQAYRTRFLVKHGAKLVTIDISDIAYFYSEDRVSFIRTWDNQRYICDYTLEEITGMLDPAQFGRLNRAFIAHIRAIAEIHNYFNGKLKLELRPATDKEVIVSRENAMEFKIWMGK